MSKKTKLSATQEDYLEAIVELIREKGSARVRDIADRLSVARPTVTSALKNLKKHELVDYTPYESVTLTKRGETVAEKISFRHEALSDFLVDVLFLDRKSAEENACRLEHSISDLAMQRLQCFVKFMKQSDVSSKELAKAFKKSCTDKIKEGKCSLPCEGEEISI